MSTPLLSVQGDPKERKLALHETGLGHIEDADGPLKVVAVVGNQRQGKSTLLNHLIAHMEQAPYRTVFGAKGGADGCTRGADCYKVAGRPIVFIDTEGLGDRANGEAFDDGLSAFAVLASSTLIFCSGGNGVQTDKMQQLGRIGQIASAMGASVRSDRAQLLWVLLGSRLDEDPDEYFDTKVFNRNEWSEPSHYDAVHVSFPDKMGMELDPPSRKMEHSDNPGDDYTKGVKRIAGIIDLACTIDVPKRHAFMLRELAAQLNDEPRCFQAAAVCRTWAESQAQAMINKIADAFRKGRDRVIESDSSRIKQGHFQRADFLLALCEASLRARYLSSRHLRPSPSEVTERMDKGLDAALDECRVEYVSRLATLAGLAKSVSGMVQQMKEELNEHKHVSAAGTAFRTAAWLVGAPVVYLGLLGSAAGADEASVALVQGYRGGYRAVLHNVNGQRTNASEFHQQTLSSAYEHARQTKDLLHVNRTLHDLTTNSFPSGFFKNIEDHNRCVATEVGKFLPTMAARWGIRRMRADWLKIADVDPGTDLTISKRMDGFEEVANGRATVIGNFTSWSTSDDVCCTTETSGTFEAQVSAAAHRERNGWSCEVRRQFKNESGSSRKSVYELRLVVDTYPLYTDGSDFDSLTSFLPTEQRTMCSSPPEASVTHEAMCTYADMILNKNNMDWNGILQEAGLVV